MVLLSAVTAVSAAPNSDIRGPIEVIRQVGPDGRGSRDAARAWRQLAAADVAQLPELLAGMDGATPLARNWLRAAIDDVLERARAAGRPLPAAALGMFLCDTRHDPQGRRLAYELIRESDPTAADRYLPGMTDDPSPELRGDAVARLLDRAEKVYNSAKKADALPLFREALAAARDQDQVEKAARRLSDLGHPVDLATQLGMVMDWKVIGPFPNPKNQAVDTAYPPEKGINLAATYDGKAGKVRWVDHVSKDPHGVVDVPAPSGQSTEAVGYAATEFTSPEARDVEIRIGCYTAFKLWVNGQLVLVRGDAYTGMSFDHYVARVRLKPGKNVFLLKLSLGEPQPGVPGFLRFQLRVCDASGRTILSASRPAPAADKKSS
jgi:hypothetical protein